MENTFDCYVGIKFVYANHCYFFGSKDLDLKVGDKVVVETTHGPELGEVQVKPISIEEYHSQLELKPVLRKATEVDVKLHETNIKDAEIASERTSAENFQKHMIFCGNKLCKTDSPDQTRRNRLVNRKKLRLPLRREAPGSKIPQSSGAKS